MAPAVFLLLIVVAGGIVATHVTLFGQVAALRGRLDALSRERERDRELLEAVLLEDPAKLRRLMGTRD